MAELHSIRLYGIEDAALFRHPEQGALTEVQLG